MSQQPPPSTPPALYYPYYPPFYIYHPLLPTPPTPPPSQPPTPKQTPRQFFNSAYTTYLTTHNLTLTKPPTLAFKTLDFYELYTQVTKRGGLNVVVSKKLWKQVADALGLPASCTDSGFRLKQHYCKWLLGYEGIYYRGGSIDDDIDSAENDNGDIVDGNDRDARKGEGGDVGSSVSPEASPDVSMDGFKKEKNRKSLSASSSACSALSTAASVVIRKSKNCCKNSRGAWKLDFAKLSVKALQKYLRFYRVDGYDEVEVGDQGKKRLVRLMTEHFYQECCEEFSREKEREIVVGFVERVRRECKG